jgi:hypothetical protein
MSLNSMSQLSYRIGRMVLLVVTAVLAVFTLLAVFRVGLIYWLNSAVEDWVTARLGFDYYAAQLVTTIIVAIFIALLPSLAWYVLLGKKQAWGIAAMIGGQAIICLLVYTVGSQVCFDRRTGKPLCYYADTQKGRVWSYTPGFDPASGQPFKLFTREIKEQEDANVRRSLEESNKKLSEENRSRAIAPAQTPSRVALRNRVKGMNSSLPSEESEPQQPESDEQHSQIAQLRQEEERQQEAEDRRQERKRQSREEEEAVRLEAERRGRAEEVRRLQQIEDQRREESARREDERERQRQEAQEQREQEAASRRREEEARHRREDERRRKDARTRVIVDLINRGIERIPRSRF